jgi:hypothetical protein
MRAAASTATPRGLANDAKVPTPSADILFDEPANTRTARDVTLTTRTRVPELTEPTYSSGHAMAKPSGEFIPAARPTPSESTHVPLPASVATARDATFSVRMRQPACSAM